MNQLSGRLGFHRPANKAAVQIIKHFEGLYLTAYKCPGWMMTIGYGHTEDVRAGQTITPEQADEFLAQDMVEAEKNVMALVKVPLSDNQFSALVSFVFNVGADNFARSTLLKLLNRGWYDQVPAQLARWNRARGEPMGGLARRRAAEARLWNSDQEDFPRTMSDEEVAARTEQKEEA